MSNSPPQTASFLRARKFQLLAFVLTTCSLIAFFVVDLHFSDDFMRTSTAASRRWFHASPFLTGWFWVFSYPFYFAVQGLIYAFVYLLAPKARSLKILFFVLLHNLLSEAAKLLYRDTRPNFQDDSLGIHGCNCSFGKPSGHSSASLLFYGLLYTEVLKHCGLRPLLRFLMILACTFVVANIGISRIYFAEHAFNQVVLGYLFGLFILTLVLLLEPELDAFFTRMTGELTTRPRRSAIFLIAFLLALNGLLLGAYFRNVPGFERSSNNPFLKSFCGRQCVGEDKLLSYHHMRSGSFANLLVFLLAALAFAPLPATMCASRFYQASWASFGIAAKRIVVYVAVSLPLIAAFIAQRFTKGLGSYFMISGLSLAYALFLVFLMRFLLIKWKAAVRGDLFVQVDLHEPRQLGVVSSDAHTDEMVETKNLNATQNEELPGDLISKENRFSTPET